MTDPEALADGPIGAFLREAQARFAALGGGEVATYIPELGKADPNLFGLAIATVDGKVYTAGDSDAAFTIQSVSKPFMYGLALETLGRAAVMKHVGVEPTGAAFNATVFDEDNNRPSNPMVNAGAIAVSALVKGETYAERRRVMQGLFSRFAGRPLDIDESVFRSERETGDRNRAIAALMRQAAMLDGDTDEILDLYFSQCSVLVTTRDLALMAAALANDGVHPQTGARVLAAECVADVLTVMHSCGMYNYAGEWSFDVGIPAKSGVAGAIIGVVPGQMGLAAFSPPLDRVGNSVRGIAAFKQIAQSFGLHVFRTPPHSGEVIRRELSGATIRSKRRRPAADRAILAEQGERIRLLEAQGALFFGSAERLLRRVGELEGACDYLIIDMRRASPADAAALHLMKLAVEQARASGRHLLFCELGRVFSPLADEITFVPGSVAVFDTSDSALEWCEDQLIAASEHSGGQAALALAQLDVFRGLSRESVKALESLARPFSFEAGQYIFREGDPARLFFVVAQGAASVRLPLENGGFVRVVSFGPGATVGEMALLDGGARSADVVADTRVVCYGFAIEDLRALAAAAPDLFGAVMFNIAADLAERLRAVNAEVRALKQ